MDPTNAGEMIVQSFEQGRLTRRRMIAQLLALGAAAAGAPVVARAQETQPATTFLASGIDHVALAVTDVQRSAAFYQKHLGLRLTRDGGESTAFLNTSGGDFLALFRADKPGLHHFSFATTPPTRSAASKLPGSSPTGSRIASTSPTPTA
jgi:Glyoxalase/Bleomycin resistance protein/Dioxygenase superfamily